jgi:hypothetical protein
MTHNGILLGFFETGCEGTFFALQEFDHMKGESWSYEGLKFIDPGDHLIISKDEEQILDIKLDGIASSDAKELPPIIDESDFFAGYKQYSGNPQHGQLCINNCWVHWLPTNVDLRLWYDVFFKNSEEYTGKLEKS